MIQVLKFGSSVLHAPSELAIAVDEIYRHWRSHNRILAVVSAFEGITDRLIEEAAQIFGDTCPAAAAAYISTGEQKTAALLVGALARAGIPSRLLDPRHIELIAVGSMLESMPCSIDLDRLHRFWDDHPILVLPGYYGSNAQGQTCLFGRGGSDLSALFIAAELNAECRLLKDVKGVFDADPAADTHAHRFTALSWPRAIEVAGPLIQPKALAYAQLRALPFCVGRPNERAGTQVGVLRDEWAKPTSPRPPLRVALLGCGTVGRGVYENLKRYPKQFDVRHVVVGDATKYADIAEVTTDSSVVLEPGIDLLVECCGGTGLAYSLIVGALQSGKFVVTANKALMAARWTELSRWVRTVNQQLWYSAAVGGALPALETLANLPAPVREIRGILNGTCGAVLDYWSQGKTRAEAITLAQAAGFAEADPVRDLSGADSADKLALLIETAFGVWVSPQDIATEGIQALSEPRGVKLIARAHSSVDGVHASVAPQTPEPGSFLSGALGAENRIEFELQSGEVIRLAGRGAGRWPTAVSVMGDLHEITRLLEDSTERLDLQRRPRRLAPRATPGASDG